MRGLSLPRLLRQAEWRGRVILRSLGAVIQMRTFFPSPARAERGEGHLFIRLDGIGDFWLWLPFVAALKKVHPDQPFYLIANRLWADLAEMTGLFVSVIPIDPNRLRRSSGYRRALVGELQQRLPPAEVLWQTTYSRRIAAEDFLAWLLPAERKIAWERDPAVSEPPPLHAPVDSHLYDLVLPCPDHAYLHEWTRYIAWLNSLPKTSPLAWEIYTELRTKFITPANHPEREPFIAVVIGAGAPFRLPAPEIWKALIHALRRRIRLPVYLFGAQSDLPYAVNLADTETKNLVGQLSLEDTVRKLASSALVLAPETGLAHIAATLGVPTLMIAGGGHWGRFVPYPAESPPFPLKVLATEMPCFGCGWMCRYQWDRSRPYPCIARISPETAIDQALLWLDMLGFQQHADTLG